MELVSVLLLILLAALLALIVSRLVRRATIYEYQQAVRFAKGRVVETLGPGTHWYLGPGSKLVLFDSRQRTLTVPGQEVLTSDGVAIKAGLLVNFQVSDPKAAILSAENYQEFLYSELQSALRELVSAVSVEELLQRRGEIGSRLHSAVRDPLQAIGLSVLSVRIKDLTFPGHLREVFAQVAKAKQEGLAALERARGETAALRNLANAARTLEANPLLLQLRLMQTIAESKTGTFVVMPRPPSAASRSGMVAHSETRATE
jgi:regulator of protease activity HflC (stomatin/prohibitin superfamily)